LKKLKKRALAFWIVVFVTLVLFFQIFGGERQPPVKEIGYSELIQKIESGNIKKITIKGKEAAILDKEGGILKLYTPYPDKLLEKLDAKTIDVQLLPADGEVISKISMYMPLIIFIVTIIFLVMLVRSLTNTGARAMGLGKSRATLHGEKNVKVRFSDVAGIDEATEELQSIVEFLKYPKKFYKLGATIPKGVLLYGPPGNGKTLLARAIAGEAGVSFMTISGSDFVEMVVGVGAARVRDLFEQAKHRAPCIIFIDELDAVGRKRNNFAGGGHEEREQTLNQLLVEMDGFQPNKGIIVIAATNRVDVLDNALLRPGRFDRHIPVTPPDVEGRYKILTVHAKKIVMDESVDLRIMARSTPGFSGADLAALVNEAALYAAKVNAHTVMMEHFEHARDKIIMGAEKQGRTIADEDRKLVAYHEAGHAVLAYYTKGAHPIHKVTIVPRGYALGMVVQLPEKDEILISKQRALASIIVSMGGRISEELFFGIDYVTSGASNDIQQATNMAKRMVIEWALSDEKETMVFRNYADEMEGRYGQNSFSEEIMKRNDERIEHILKNCYARARETILQYKEKLEKLAQALLEFETMSLDEVKNLFENNILPVRTVEEKKTKKGTKKN
jgi:cell division protease FtsH